MKTVDGTGAPLVDDASYYVQDVRSVVGNCGSWWAPKGAGYVCSIDEAGLYTGKEVSSMRDTDVPWPAAYVLERVVRHVRVDNQAFRAVDVPGEKAPRVCHKCGAPENDHPYRHMFVAWRPGMAPPGSRRGS